MARSGYKIIGIAEYDGGLYNPNGIDIDALLRTPRAQPDQHPRIHRREAA